MNLVEISHVSCDKGNHPSQPQPCTVVENVRRVFILSFVLLSDSYTRVGQKKQLPRLKK